ncbi:FtsX-like permease family protein [Alteromonas sp. a30]|uniref:FtsX-like permease family protein n=1 Tax=Alteromonas sp. a30 TaxID=2730917 RepID=UPI00227FB6DC|nr:FtsX-like permease family protein [Alteromonas sp. a30]MCY7297170.1 ABC transporter permease [Alteromonas sp. a30]
MWFGLWRYWSNNKTEFTLIALSFSIIFQLITLLSITALSESLFRPFSEKIAAFGTESSTGVLNRTDAVLSNLLSESHIVTQHTRWYVDNLSVGPSQVAKELPVAFINDQYIHLLKPKFSAGRHLSRCELDRCYLIGVAISYDLQHLVENGNIQIGSNLYPVSGILSKNALQFPDGDTAKIVLDISEFPNISSFQQTFSTISGLFSHSVTPEQITQHLPIFKTIVELSNAVTASEREQYLQQLLEQYQNSRTSQLSKMFHLAGSNNLKLGLIEGAYFDRATKNRTETRVFLFSISALLLTFVSAAIFISIVSRHRLRRAPERALRFSIGSSKVSLFINENLFILLPLILGTILGFLSLPLGSAIFKTLLLELPNLDKQYTHQLALHYAVISIGTLLTIPSICNADILTKGISGRTASHSRGTIVAVRILTRSLITLMVFSLFVISFIYQNWYKISSLALGSINENVHAISLFKSSDQKTGTQWESTINNLRQITSSLSLLQTMPGDRRLTHKPLTIDDEKCSYTFQSWSNQFFGNPFQLLLESPSSLDNWDSNHIAISRSMLQGCNWSEKEAIGQYLVDEAGSRYRINSVVDDIRYDLHVTSPQYVFYRKASTPENLRQILFADKQDSDAIFNTLNKNLKEFNLEYDITFKGSLKEYIEKELVNDRAIMQLTAILMISCLVALALGYTQHFNKILKLRSLEWGVMRAMGADKSSLLKLLTKENTVDLSIAFLINLLLLIAGSSLLQDYFNANFLTGLFVLLGSTLFILLILHLYVSSKSLLIFAYTPSDLLREKN